MALATIDYYSDALRRKVDFRVIVPDPGDRGENPHYNRGMKTLILLHGYTGAGSDWLLNSTIVDIADRCNLCVLIPSGENSFYLDGKATGRKYSTYIGQELPEFAAGMFHLSRKREDMFIAGFSMGGFGAIHASLRFNQTFGKIAALSSALIVHEVAQMKPGSGNDIANYEYYELMFGKPAELISSENNPEELIRRLQTAGEMLPEMYLACGTEDFLLQQNRAFVNFLQEKKVPHVYEETSGDHNFEFWNPQLSMAIEWMLELE
ncbi:alpha/beta hydrolase [Spirochaeta dissipatitropha]